VADMLFGDFHPMGSVNSTSSILSNVLQSLATESPQLSSILSTPKVQSALENASPGDLVELSDQALQLQQTGVLFGNLDGTQSTGLNSTSDPLFSVLSSGGSDSESALIAQAMENSTASTGTTATATTNLQVQELEALLGATSTVDQSISTLG
jgi:hypothetical protein